MKKTFDLKVGDLVEVWPLRRTGMVVGSRTIFERGIEARVLTVDGLERTVSAYRLKIIARGSNK